MKKLAALVLALTGLGVLAKQTVLSTEKSENPTATKAKKHSVLTQDIVNHLDTDSFQDQYPILVACSFNTNACN